MVGIILAYQHILVLNHLSLVRLLRRMNYFSRDTKEENSQLQQKPGYLLTLTRYSYLMLPYGKKIIVIH